MSNYKYRPWEQPGWTDVVWEDFDEQGCPKWGQIIHANLCGPWCWWREKTPQFDRINSALWRSFYRNGKLMEVEE